LLALNACPHRAHLCRAVSGIVQAPCDVEQKGLLHLKYIINKFLLRCPRGMNRNVTLPFLKSTCKSCSCYSYAICPCWARETLLHFCKHSLKKGANASACFHKPRSTPTPTSAMLGSRKAACASANAPCGVKPPDAAAPETLPLPLPLLLASGAQSPAEMSREGKRGYSRTCAVDRLCELKLLS